jgi:hypothetical protein
LLSFHGGAMSLVSQSPCVPGSDELAEAAAGSRKNAEQQLEQVEELIRAFRSWNAGWECDSSTMNSAGFRDRLSSGRATPGYFLLRPARERSAADQPSAIARGEVPMEHWWAIGRPFGQRMAGSRSSHGAARLFHVLSRFAKSQAKGSQPVWVGLIEPIKRPRPANRLPVKHTARYRQTRYRAACCREASKRVVLIN